VSDSEPDLASSSANAEIARVDGNYAVQGHSRSLILIPIESPLPVCDFILINNINLILFLHRYSSYCTAFIKLSPLTKRYLSLKH